MQEPVTVINDGDKTLRRLLDSIHDHLSRQSGLGRKEVRLQMSVLTNTARRIAETHGSDIDHVLARNILDDDALFTEHLNGLKFRPDTICHERGRRRKLVAYLRQFDWYPEAFALEAEWEPTVKAALARKLYITAITDFAKRNQIRPQELSELHMLAWANEMAEKGRVRAIVLQLEYKFRLILRLNHMEGSFPLLNLRPRELPCFALSIDAMDPQLRNQVLGLLEWMRSRKEEASQPFIETKDAMDPVTPDGTLDGASQETCQSVDKKEIQAPEEQVGEQASEGGKEKKLALAYEIEEFCGWADNEGRMEGIVDFRQLLTVENVTNYAHWLSEARDCTRHSIGAHLTNIHVVARFHPDFAGVDVSWWYSVLADFDLEEKSSKDERRENLQLPYRKLLEIPAKIRADLATVQNPSPETIRWFLHDALLMDFLTKFLWSPDIIRTCGIGGPSPNIFKRPISKDGPEIAIPESAKESLRTNPELAVWQYDFGTVRGYRACGLILQALIEPLEEYLHQLGKHPKLLAVPGTTTLFVNRNGGPLSPPALGRLIGDLTEKHGGKRVTPGSIRGSFLDYWIDQYPKGFEALANILWVDLPYLKSTYDEEYRKQRKARIYSPRKPISARSHRPAA